jgi:hypothetical protein
MEKEIGFSGINLTPYSDISPDGQLTYSHGLEMHNGSLRPSVLAGLKAKLAMRGQSSALTGYTLQTVHSSSSFNHLIFTDELGSVAWCEESGMSTNYLSLTSIGKHDQIYKISTVGNTLIVHTVSGPAYYLWTNSAYEFLGTEMPELKVRFSLIRVPYHNSSDDEGSNEWPTDHDTSPDFYVLSDGRIMDEEYDPNKDPTYTAISNYIISEMNLITEECDKNSYFYAPFFVRCAYRLFDGNTYTRLTCPMLMIPATKPGWILRGTVSDKSEHTGYTEYKLKNGLMGIKTMYHKLAMVVDSDTTELTKWKDIISGIDVFATRQTLSYNTDSEISKVFVEGKGYTAFGVSAFGGRAASNDTTKDKAYITKDFDFTSSFGDVYCYLLVNLDFKSDKDYAEELIGNSQFYKIVGFSVDEFITKANNHVWESLDIAKYTITNLVQKDMLDDGYDYRSHDKLIAQSTYVYNQRLHLYNVSRQLFEGFTFPYMNQYAYSGTEGTINLSVYINGGDGTTRIVTASYTGDLMWDGRFFYYPDAKAYQIVVQKVGSALQVYPLTSHPYLQGAYYLGWPDLGSGSSNAELSGYKYDRNNTPIAESNKIYVSQVGNPFVFLASNIYTVGIGTVLGISSLATPLSQGQFGQYQLIAFCSDGNYALEVNSEGGYTNIAPTQRDVCITPSTITQTDQEVVFVAQRGVMTTNGAGIQCISMQMDGVADNMPDSIPKNFYIPTPCLESLLKTSLIAYDYANQRFIFFPGKTAYVYSLITQTWNTASFGIVKQVLNVYPSSYVQFEDETVMKLCRPEQNGAYLKRCLPVKDVNLDGRFSSTSDSNYTEVYDGGDASSTYGDEYSEDYSTYDGGDASSVYDPDKFSESNPIYEGVLLTRALKLDTYRLKRISQFALQGLFSEEQRIILYASQDGTRWLRLGATDQRRIRMIGKVFKFFRFAIITKLKSTENITGIRLDYQVMSEKRYR